MHVKEKIFNFKNRRRKNIIIYRKNNCRRNYEL